MSKKRGNGEGSVYRDGARGGWMAEAVIDDKRRRFRAATRTDAVAKMNKARAQADAGTLVADGNATVGQVLDQWAKRELANRDLAPSSMESYRWALDALQAELGKVRLRSLDVARVERGLDTIAAGQRRPLSKRSLKYMRSTLAQALDYGIKRRLLGTNPARLAELTPTATPARARRALNHDEAAALWAVVADERLGGWVRLMLSTGLRPGEALALCWDAVDLDAGLLHVRRGVRLVKGRAVLVDELKTSPSWRTIRLPEPAVEVLRAQRRRVAAMVLEAKAWPADAPALVFPTTTAGPWNLRNARRELAGICERAGIGDVLPHELRHSCASILNDLGVPLEDIADLLGHVDTSMVSRVYRHRLRPSVDAAVAPMNKMFG